MKKKRAILAKAPILAISALLTPAAFATNGIGLADPPDSYPIVITPARLRQSLQDVPASVTVITAEMIRKFGILTVPDALRLVPGMAITAPTGGDYRINYHGTNALSPRRMNVLIDGVSVYQPLFARVDWTSLPVAVDDIDRIEVTRGPNSAAYGPNSMMAIINIITKHPGDVERAMASVTRGSRGFVDETARVGVAFGPTAMRITVNKQRDQGYDYLSRTGGAGGARDTLETNRLNVRSQTRLSDSTTIDVDAAYLAGTKEVAFVDQYQQTNPDQKVRDGYAAITLRSTLSPTHEVQFRTSYSSNSVKQQWYSCPPTAFLLPEMFDLYRANPQFVNAILRGQVPSGGSAGDAVLVANALRAIARLGPGGAKAPVCGTPNHNFDEQRLDLELQDTFVFSDELRLVSGIGGRKNSGSSETFLAGYQSNSLWRVFANAEYKPSRTLTLNAGAYYERDQLTSPVLSPRLGANWKPSSTQTFRFAWSSASRTPDLHEQVSNWTYPIRDLSRPINGTTSSRFYQSAMSSGGLLSERIASSEIGYLLRLPASGLLLDVRFFDERLTSLISEKLQVADFRPTNTNSARLRGVDVQTNLELSADWTVFAHYGYLDNESSTVFERSQYSRHSGAAGVAHSFGDGWSWSIAYYGSSADGPGQTPFGRTDVLMTKGLRLGSTKGTVSLGAQRLNRKSATYFRDVNSTYESAYNDRLQILGRLQISF